VQLCVHGAVESDDRTKRKGTKREGVKHSVERRPLESSRVAMDRGRG